MGRGAAEDEANESDATTATEVASGMSADSDSDADVAPTERHREGSADDAEVRPGPAQVACRSLESSAGALVHVCIADGKAEQFQMESEPRWQSQGHARSDTSVKVAGHGGASAHQTPARVQTLHPRT